MPGKQKENTTTNDKQASNQSKTLAIYRYSALVPACLPADHCIHICIGCILSVCQCRVMSWSSPPFESIQPIAYVYIVGCVTPIDQLWRHASVWLRLFIFIANVKKNVCLAHNIMSMNAKPEAYVCEPKSRLLMRVLARVLCLDICIVASIIFRAPFLWWLGREMACYHYYGIYFCKYD